MCTYYIYGIGVDCYISIRDDCQQINLTLPDFVILNDRLWVSQCGGNILPPPTSCYHHHRGTHFLRQDGLVWPTSFPWMMKFVDPSLTFSMFQPKIDISCTAVHPSFIRTAKTKPRRSKDNEPGNSLSLWDDARTLGAECTFINHI